MKRLPPLLACLAIAASPTLAVAAPAEDKAYKAVDDTLSRTLTEIRRDLVALGDSGKFPQLKTIGDSEIKRLDYNGNHNMLNHHHDAFAVDGGGFRCGKEGYIIKLDLLSYDAKTDPRFGLGASAVRPIPHFMAKASGVPFGVDCQVAAGDTESGKAFVKAARELIDARLEDMRGQLDAAPVKWDELINPPKRLSAAELEKEAYIILEGIVTGHSEKRYKETGQPERMEVKVTKVLGGKKGHEDWARVDEVIPMDTWGLKPVIDLPVGTAIKGYFSIGHTQGADGVLRPFYGPAAPNAVQVTGKAAE